MKHRSRPTILEEELPLNLRHLNKKLFNEKYSTEQISTENLNSLKIGILPF